MVSQWVLIGVTVTSAIVFNAISLSSLIFILVTLVFFSILALYMLQDKMLYLPNSLPPQFAIPSQIPSYLRSPAEYSVDYEDISLITEDGVTLNAWLCKHNSQQSLNTPTILFFHGNAGNINMRLPNIMPMLRKLEANIFIVSYRGYGKSNGVPSENGLMFDARAALTHLQKRKDINSESIVLYGRSLGGAVAIYLASQFPNEIKGLVIENTFCDISSMVDYLFPILKPLKQFLLCNDWPSLQRIPEVTAPILFISGDMDEIVPSSHMQQLYNAADTSSSKTMIRVKDGKHNDTWLVAGNDYWDALKQFMKQLF